MGRGSRKLVRGNLSAPEEIDESSHGREEDAESDEGAFLFGHPFRVSSPALGSRAERAFGDSTGCQYFSDSDLHSLQ